VRLLLSLHTRPSQTKQPIKCCSAVLTSQAEAGESLSWRLERSSHGLAGIDEAGTEAAIATAFSEILCGLLEEVDRLAGGEP